MTTLEKAEYIVKTGGCVEFFCGSDGSKCPINISTIGKNACSGSMDTANLCKKAIKEAQAYIDANKPKENTLKTVKEFYQEVVNLYENGSNKCKGSIGFEFKMCIHCPAVKACGSSDKEVLAVYTFCKAQLAKETEFKYGQTVYGLSGEKYFFITKAPDNSMIATLGPIPSTNGGISIRGVGKGTFFADDPTKKEKTMTITDIEKALGYKIKVVGEK